nr:thioesterase family protein [uncultured Carboxylicivirga sp.]
MQSSLKTHPFVHQHRVGYAETDKMQFLHHSNYARIYENARWEFFRSINIPYSFIEDQGLFMPVINMDFKFIKPAFYDDNLSIEVRVNNISNIKLAFTYVTFNQKGELINEATVTLAFIKADSGKPIRTPEFIKERLVNESALV